MKEPILMTADKQEGNAGCGTSYWLKYYSRKIPVCKRNAYKRINEQLFSSLIDMRPLHTVTDIIYIERKCSLPQIKLIYPHILIDEWLY